MLMRHSVPAGFVLMNEEAGFGGGFGPIYLQQDAHKLGFWVALHHLNLARNCHGGAMATFADMQITAVKPAPGIGDTHSPTINISVDYLSPAPLDSWVEATVTLAKATRTLIFTQALITADGNLVARSTAIYRNYVPDMRAAKNKRN